MQQVRIANILLEESRQYRTSPLLYVRSSSAVVKSENGWKLSGASTFDFTTFFNALSVSKYDEYTSAKSYQLHLELKGAAARITQTCADTFDFYPRPQGDAIEIPASDTWVTLDLDINYEKSDVLAGFIIETQGDVFIQNSYYLAAVENGDLRSVNLALSTTTFKKENYITHNMELVRSQILESQEAIASHFRMYVIDNGRTLDAESLSGDGITVYPNRNVGGSGGFAYGMLLAQEQADVTHILLMDDDVEVSPESIKRTYNLLTIVNDEYKDAFVSGAMMNFDEPDIHWEDLGFMTFNGIYKSLKPVTRLSVLHDCVACEGFVPEEEIYPDTKQRYAAWWYCCIPISMIKRNGMPLPFFVRFDDVEYSLRSHPRFMTLNGICVWHLAFFMRYNAAQERYQTVRNGLVGQDITGVAPMSDFMVEIKLSMTRELCKFNYKDAELICEGLEDYLRGPEWFAQKDVAEKRFMDANKNREKIVPLSELTQLVRDELGVDISSFTAADFQRDYPLGGKERGRLYNYTHRQLFEGSLNGQLRGSLKPIAGNTAFVEATGWAYPMGALYGVDHVVAVNIPMKMGVIRHRDNARCKQIWDRFQNDLKLYEQNKKELSANYAAARKHLTSVEYWKEYLDLD
ncbi:MAG: glycosyltransferase [Atopobiaceae bacterium]|jgi:galactofuranosylgalactofuranosylrhamnosyl-N-acetylglucosaminyl-diphospho-decaprenol beta-1,5/1,6-galactofuranosyltransferase